MIEQLATWLLSREHGLRAQRWLPVALHGWIVLFVLSLAPWHAVFWGRAALIPRHEGVVAAVVASGYPWLLAALVGSCVAGMLRRGGCWPALISLVLLRWLDTRAWFARDGGNRLVYQLLPLVALMNLRGAPTPPSRWRELRVGAGNVALALARWQVFLVYEVAGLTKALEPSWRQGDALHRILLHPTWNDGTLGALLLRHPAWCAALGWAIIAYEVLFPLGVLVRKTRTLTLVLGVLFHVAVAEVMGLMFFSLAMVASYAVFLSERPAPQPPSAFADIVTDPRGP